MKISELAIKIQCKMLNGRQSFLTMDINDKKKILKRFKEPLDLFERSYYQYLCQMKQLPLVLKIIQSLAAIFLTPYYFYKYSKDNNVTPENKKRVGVFISGIKDISYVPETLKNEFDKIILCDYNCSSQLTIREKRVITQIYKRYWYKPYFCIKCMMKIALYAYQINQHNPKAILTFGEFSFTSSALTYYCNEIGIEHINVMHGEKLFNIRDAFVEFNRYYVWDQHYIDLLIQLGADGNQFRIEEPIVLRLNIKNQKEYKYEFTYYLGGESEKDLYKIKVSLLNTGILQEKICIRYHPRYSDERQIKNIFERFNIENPNEVPINVSIAQTKYVTSLYSTVLFQAYKNGKTVIIDDISNPLKYEKLRSLKYIMMNKPHLLLSELVNKAQ